MNKLTVEQKTLLSTLKAMADDNGKLLVNIMEVVDISGLGYEQSAFVARELTDMGYINVDFPTDSDKILFTVLNK